MRLPSIVRHQQGFTLAEVLIAVTILGILVNIGIPTSANQLPKYRLHAATRQVMSDLLIARTQAMSQEHVVQVPFRNPQHYVIWQDRNDGLCTCILRVIPIAPKPGTMPPWHHDV